MRALIKKDLILFKNISLFYKLLFVIYVIMFVLISRKSNFNNYDIFLIITGSFYKVGSTLCLLSSIIINGILVLLTFYIYRYDLKYNPEFIFLKITRKKWLQSKYISLFIINCLLFIFIAFIYIMLGNKLNLHLGYYLIVIIINKYFLQILLVTLLNHFNFISSLIIFFFLIISPILFKTIILANLYVENYIDNPIIVTIFIIMLIMVSFFLNCKKVGWLKYENRS